MADGEYTTLELVKADMDIDDVDDDTELQAKVDAANDRITRKIGMFIGPSDDTVRTYDGREAVHGVVDCGCRAASGPSPGSGSPTTPAAR
jgi:hypothetical protein